MDDPNNWTNNPDSWLAVVVMVLHFAGGIIKQWSDAAVKKYLEKPPKTEPPKPDGTP